MKLLMAWFTSPLEPNERTRPTKTLTPLNASPARSVAASSGGAIS
jgi:hypothetical protein